MNGENDRGDCDVVFHRPGRSELGYFRVVVGSSGVAIQGEAKVEG